MAISNTLQLHGGAQVCGTKDIKERSVGAIKLGTILSYVPTFFLRTSGTFDHTPIYAQTTPTSLNFVHNNNH